jgi:arginase
MIGPIAIIGAPSGIGIRPYDDGGIRRLDLAPGALREHGISARLAAHELGDVMPPSRYQDVTKPAGRVRNEDDVIAYSRKLADSIAAASADGSFVLLLGGDCSILLGALLGLRTAGRTPVGLVYIDAHSDFGTLDESASGSACSMNLALAVGRANDTPLMRLGGDEPLVREADVVHIGSRDAAELYGYDALAASPILTLPDPVLQKKGPAHAAQEALSRVSQVGGGFWIHTDVDVLDPDLMPAVDSPLPGGLTFDELAELLTPIARHPRALGLQLTIYDPTLDSEGAGAARLCDLLETVFVSREPI